MFIEHLHSRVCLYEVTAKDTVKVYREDYIEELLIGNHSDNHSRIKSRDNTLDSKLDNPV